ncbi:MAG: hypothetical protein VX453_14745 [Acidobacteriota bacterium]|nr:hypothetical protein [Acidobacteriota bacterium]
MRAIRILTGTAAVMVFTLPVPAAQRTISLPSLMIDAPASLEGVANQVRRFPLEPLATAMTLAGLTHPGRPIQVLLIAENSELARNTPSWISGLADASRDLVVLFPERSRSYPANSLKTLLHHEVAHILFSRAARGRIPPRWFNEGLALAAERPVGLEDRSRLAWTLIRHGGVSLEELERLFNGGRVANQRAYTVSSALVRNLLTTYGDVSAGRVLALLGQDQPFYVAFETATGESLTGAVDRFWRRQTAWTWWLAFLTGPAFLWSVITLLALYAISVHRRRRAEQRLRWDEEEAAAPRHLLDTDTPVSGTSYEVH